MKITLSRLNIEKVTATLLSNQDLDRGIVDYQRRDGLWVCSGIAATQ
ncbi:hypothetical protein [Edaphobacter aggregans]|nr:hypothetical protein [Edaphobacter aggregans]